MVINLETSPKADVLVVKMNTDANVQINQLEQPRLGEEEDSITEQLELIQSIMKRMQNACDKQKNVSREIIDGIIQVEDELDSINESRRKIRESAKRTSESRQTDTGLYTPTHRSKWEVDDCTGVRNNVAAPRREAESEWTLYRTRGRKESRWQKTNPKVSENIDRRKNTGK
ncbi:hypothetical protein J437_LFUL018556 [Ladona fulva]|uniref:Uncharacterized protein n=1 Tax=Ladona fulva TaxID=123851 RepID=A0A8K0KSV0_LADFU|nr:hypothetical protein J437_LFUL018556 [Ladona fulva]